MSESLWFKENCTSEERSRDFVLVKVLLWISWKRITIFSRAKFRGNLQIFSFVITKLLRQAGHWIPAKENCRRVFTFHLIYLFTYFFKAIFPSGCRQSWLSADSIIIWEFPCILGKDKCFLLPSPWLGIWRFSSLQLITTQGYRTYFF